MQLQLETMSMNGVGPELRAGAARWSPSVPELRGAAQFTPTQRHRTTRAQRHTKLDKLRALALPLLRELAADCRARVLN